MTNDCQSKDDQSIISLITLAINYKDNQLLDQQSWISLITMKINYKGG